uniref:Uncharacterized protein n=1 Tax=Syphacia muris TaxID=451379 RepID=A0A0N5AYI7_9BILA
MKQKSVYSADRVYIVQIIFGPQKKVTMLGRMEEEEEEEEGETKGRKFETAAAVMFMTIIVVDEVLVAGKYEVFKDLLANAVVFFRMCEYSVPACRMDVCRLSDTQLACFADTYLQTNI